MGIVILGAGAIGGSLGACLIRAGQDVLLVDRDAEHVAAMNAEGLRLEGRETFRVAAHAVLPEGLAGALGGATPQTVVLATKAQHTEAALHPVLPLLGGDSIVLSLQNGLNPHEVAALAGAQRTIAASINSMAADWQAPGLILFGGPGTIRIGELDGRITPSVQALADLLRVHYVSNTAITDNVWGHLWGKEAYGAWLFAQAACGATIAEVLEASENGSMLANLAAEVIAVAEAEGVRVEAVDQFIPDAVRFGVPRHDAALRHCLFDMAALNRRSHKPRSGIWRDLAVRGRNTEVDAQLGIVVRLGAKHAIPTPLVTKLIAIIHALERQEIPMGEENLAALRAVDATSYAI